MTASALKKDNSDADIETLDALVAAGMSKTEVLEGTYQMPSSTSNTSDNNYIETEKLKPVGHRSIFAPSTEYLEKKAKTEVSEELEL